MEERCLRNEWNYYLDTLTKLDQLRGKDCCMPHNGIQSPNLDRIFYMAIEYLEQLPIDDPARQAPYRLVINAALDGKRLDHYCEHLEKDLRARAERLGLSLPDSASLEGAL